MTTITPPPDNPPDPPLPPRLVAFCEALERAAAERGLPWEPWPL